MSESSAEQGIFILSSFIGIGVGMIVGHFEGVLVGFGSGLIALVLGSFGIIAIIDIERIVMKIFKIKSEEDE